MTDQIGTRHASSAGHPQLTGTASSDVISALSGFDTTSALDEADLIYGNHQTPTAARNRHERRRQDAMRRRSRA